MPDFQTFRWSSIEFIATTGGRERGQTTPDRARPPDSSRANTPAYTSLAKMAKNPRTPAGPRGLRARREPEALPPRLVRRAAQLSRGHTDYLLERRAVKRRSRAVGAGRGGRDRGGNRAERADTRGVARNARSTPRSRDLGYHAPPSGKHRAGSVAACLAPISQTRSLNIVERRTSTSGVSVSPLRVRRKAQFGPASISRRAFLRFAIMPASRAVPRLKTEQSVSRNAPYIAPHKRLPQWRAIYRNFLSFAAC